MITSIIKTVVSDVMSPSLTRYGKTQWRTLRLFSHTLDYFGRLSREEGMTVPQFLDYLEEFIKELKEKIKDLEQEVSDLESALSNCENKENTLWNI